MKVSKRFIKSKNRIRIVGANIEVRPSSDYHTQTICKKATNKLHVLSRASKYTGISKIRILIKSFITSHLSCYPLKWMLHSRNMESRISEIKE